jgi:hypothetical protein
MSEPEEKKLTDEELADFHQKVDQLKATLSPEQLELLEAILKLAWNATEHEDALENGFAGSFSSHQATTLMGYEPAAGSGPVTAITRLIRHSLIR